MKKATLVLVAVLSMFLQMDCAPVLFGLRKPVGQHAHTFNIEANETNVNYLLFLPDKYNKEKKDWPLILFLHGSGERGSVIDSVKKHGPPKIVEQVPDFPFIVLSPQCPKEQQWSNDILIPLLDEIVKKYRVDEKRIYLTGLSMGGFGTWALAIQYPHRFAAIAPICGGGDTSKVCVLKNVPTWVFHGAKDQTVPISRSQEMVDALKKCGGKVRFTVYPDAGHDAWTKTYGNPEFYKWFLQIERK